MEKRDFRILFITPPHTSTGSRNPPAKPPPGLLCVAGPLMDAGFPVKLLNADFGTISLPQVVAQIIAHAPSLVMICHSGSTSAHVTLLEIAAALKHHDPPMVIIYGGVFPTDHWQDILCEGSPIDVIVRGEGEITPMRLVNMLFRKKPIFNIAGIALRIYGKAHFTGDVELFRDRHCLPGQREA
jgi:anaerobic magnesium-protoporphyrin IX monomethyl ester cyclase